MKIDKPRIRRESISGDNDSFVDAELTPDDQPLQKAPSENARPVKGDMELYQQRAWERQKNELLNQGYLNEGILARLRVYWEISEDWKIVKGMSNDADIDIDNELVIPEVLNKANIRRERAHASLQVADRDTNSLEGDLDHAILDILLDQDTVEQFGNKKQDDMNVYKYRNKELLATYTHRYTTGTGHEIGFINGLGLRLGGSIFGMKMDEIEKGESSQLLESITHKKQKIALAKKSDAHSKEPYPSIKDLDIPICHFRKDFLTILYVLSEHSQELDFLQGKVFDSPEDVMVFAEKLYEYGKERVYYNGSYLDGFNFHTRRTPLSEIEHLTFMDQGYACGYEEEYGKKIGMLIRSEIQAAIQKIHEKKNKDLLNLRAERNNLLLDLFHVQAALAEPVTAPQQQKKSWLPWKRKEESSSSEEILEMQRKKRKIIETLQQEKYWGNKSLIPSEDDLITLAIKAQ